MYIERNDLGQFDPVGAAFAVTSLKNVFGIGKKKRKFKALEPGAWSSQAPDIDWREYLAKFNGAVKKDYDRLRARKDTTLIKNNIATPEDYAVWHWVNYGSKHAENNKDWLPFRTDGTRIDRPPKAASAPAQTAIPATPATPAPQQAVPAITPPPPPAVAPGPVYSPPAPPAPAQFFPGLTTPSTTAAPNVAKSDNTLLYAGLAISGAALLLTLQRKRR